MASLPEDALVATYAFEELIAEKTRALVERTRPRDDRGGSKWYPIWRPQRDEDPNGIPADFVIALDRSRPPAKRRGGKRTDGGGRKHA